MFAVVKNWVLGNTIDILFVSDKFEEAVEYLDKHINKYDVFTVIKKTNYPFKIRYDVVKPGIIYGETLMFTFHVIEFFK